MDEKSAESPPGGQPPEDEQDVTPTASDASTTLIGDEDLRGPAAPRTRVRSSSLGSPPVTAAETEFEYVPVTSYAPMPSNPISNENSLLNSTDGSNLSLNEIVMVPPSVCVQSEANLTGTPPIEPIGFMQSDPTLIVQSLPRELDPPPRAPIFFPRKSSKPKELLPEEKVVDPRTAGRARNQSEMEINAQHYRIQRQYKADNRRTRHLTDIDFEGTLNIVGFSWWQIMIYLMISAHQIPHAMFNLSVVYLTFQPDHWCKIPSFSKEYFNKHANDIAPGWTWEKALDSGIAFPLVPNPQRRGKITHDRCSFYRLPSAEYRKFLRMDPNLAMKLVAQRNTSQLKVERCKAWDYDDSTMKDTVVQQWNRVCDDNWSRAHVHLSYSLGYLLGCIAGGFVSDRYGRKSAIYGFSLLSTIFGFLLPFSREFEVFLVVRFLLAVCNEAADLAAYVLCMEITGVKYRSLVGSLLQAPWACGYAFLALVAYLCKSWVNIQMVTTLLHFLALFLIHHLPESPRWLVVMNRIDEAEQIIRRACHLNKSSLPSDLGIVRHAELRKWKESLQRPHFLHTFKLQAMSFRNIILLVVWTSVALVYYGVIIALSDQSSPGRSMFVGNFFLNNALAGAIELPTLIGCVYLLQFGRKRSQVITLISAGTLIFIAMIASLKEEMTFSLIFMLAGKACIQGAFNILYIFTSELYPTVIRNSAVGMCSMVARIGAGASGYIAILSDVTLPIVPMGIFCLFSLFAGVLIYFLPETRDLPLPDTMFDAITMLKNNNSYRCAAGIEKGGGKDGDEDEDSDEYTSASNPPPDAQKASAKNGAGTTQPLMRGR